MRHTFALAVAAVALVACSESLGPRPERRLRASAPSLSESQEQALPGTPAAVLGSLDVGDLSSSTAAAAAAVDPQQQSSRDVVLPNAYTNMMGETSNTFPHAVANMRYQQVFLGAELQGLRSVRGLCLRRDELFGGPAGTQQLTIKLGPTQLNHLTLTPVFDANYSAPPTTVFTGAVNIPASTGGGTPDDFYICIDFTTPYIHPAGSNVIVEILNTSAFSLVHFEDFCRLNVVCTTRRVFAFSTTAAVGFMDASGAGLVMKFIAGDPTSKEECKDGGWMDFGFRNQGQCIRFVETGKDSR